MKQNFTLIELVVVIAIVGSVAAVLFPIFAQQAEHQKRQHRVSCLSNAKQSGVGLVMYAQDYDNHFPPAAKWMTLTLPYLPFKNPTPTSLFLCPDANDKKESRKVVSNYAMDSRLGGKSLEQLAEPGRRALFYDSTRTDWDAADPGQTFADRHHWAQKVGSLAYADGHAKLVTRDVFVTASQEKWEVPKK